MGAPVVRPSKTPLLKSGRSSSRLGVVPGLLELLDGPLEVHHPEVGLAEQEADLGYAMDYWETHKNMVEVVS